LQMLPSLVIDVRKRGGEKHGGGGGKGGADPGFSSHYHFWDAKKKKKRKRGKKKKGGRSQTRRHLNPNQENREGGSFSKGGGEKSAEFGFFLRISSYHGPAPHLEREREGRKAHNGGGKKKKGRARLMWFCNLRILWPLHFSPPPQGRESLKKKNTS